MEQQLNSNPPVPSTPTVMPSSVADPQASSVPPIVEERIVKPSGETSVRRYIKGKFLGKGGFAKCYEFTSQETGLINAAKVILKASLTKSRAKQKLMSEIKIHRSVKHQYVVQFQHFFEDADNVYILLELCHNQSLNELLRRRKRLHELEVQCYTMQIINALKYLHAHRIIHRDLKLGNLFINDKMEVKLGDFGLAAKLDFDGEKKRTICGTPNYIAPEVLEGKSGHSYEVDVWSLGVIIYTLIVGKPPFETSDVKTTYKRIRMNAYTFPDHVVVSDAAKDLIQRILIGDPTSRPTLDEIIKHDFLTRNAIPKSLPPSFLACPPSAQYLKQYLAPQTSSHSAHPYSTSQQPSTQQRLESTAPAGINKIPVTPGSLLQGTQSNRVPSANPMTRGASIDPNTQQMLFTDRGGVYNRKNTPAGAIASSERQTTQMTVSQQQFYTNNAVVQPTSQRERMLSPSGLSNYPSAPLNLKKAQSIIPPQLEQMTSNQQLLRGPSVWIKKWVDYSSKYGLGYLLSNNATGVFFNDSTKIVLDQASQGQNGKNLFYYYERKPISATEKQDVMTTHSLLDYPKELQKKVTLLQHFRSYLENNAQTNSGTNGPTSGKSANIDTDVEMRDETVQKMTIGGPIVYVKKWMRTKHAIMFRLSNKIVQVSFQDHTEILLNSESRLVTYVNKKGERQTLPLNQALESNNAEMTKRLKYTKDILTHMLNNNTHGTNSNRPSSSIGGGAGSSTNGQNVIQSQNIHPGQVPHSAAQGKRSEMMLGATLSVHNAADFQSVLNQNAGAGSHRRPLNIINNQV